MIFFSLAEGINSIVAKLQTEPQPGSLNDDVVHTAHISMCGKLIKIIVWMERLPIVISRQSLTK